MKQDINLLEGNIYRLFTKYFINSVAAMAMIAFYILVDTIFIGRGVGSDGLAALNIVLPVFNLTFAIGLMIGIGGATSMSVSLGQNQRKTAKTIFTTAMYLAISMGLLFTVLGSFFLDEIAFFLGATDNNIDMVTQYMQVIMGVSFSFMIVNVISAFVRNDKAPQIAMWVTVASCITNITLDWVFIFILHWGMRGAALATAISSLQSLVIFSFYLIRGTDILKFVKVKLDVEIIKRIVFNGFSNFVIELSSGIVIFAFNITLLKHVGEVGITAYSIVANISLICVAVFTGVAQAVQPLVSINYGAKKNDRIKRVRNLGLISAAVIGVVFYITGIAFPGQIVSLFVTDATELMELGSEAINYYFIAFIFMGVNIVMGSYFQAMEKAYYATIISMCRGVGFIILGLIVLPAYLSTVGIWLTVPFAETLTLFVVLGIYLALAKKQGLG
ncbi:MATE family efflux transporter [Alkalicella caledoniensis]|uniref:Multidrug export protein MepA n=1 Tax=Alkalicella caledoniensis TaxID=2731377 RepID=A0A7G9W7H4_ALKCA|nr:MATE family efflux transporter [Alkalicella caledoniensis]QNO14636.1 MATE family efflux transporter [Alkalicella caledoniensis]